MENIEIIKLWDKTPEYDPEKGLEEPCLLAYPAEGAKKCVLVIPGGGYCWRAEDHEGIELAKMFNKNGITAFVLRYRHHPYKHPIPMNDALRAVRVVRKLSEKYGYESDQIGVMGFSAGGHLAMTAATQFDYGRDDGDETDRISSRPDLCMLCYAVTEIGTEFTHWGSTVNLLGNDFNRELAAKLSCANAIKDDTPPCFIWATAEDDCVPVEDSLHIGLALSKKKIPYELHIYPYGPHGLGTADNLPLVSSWTGLCLDFINYHFKK